MIQEIFQRLGGPNLAVIPRQIVVAWSELLKHSTRGTNPPKARQHHGAG